MTIWGQIERKAKDVDVDALYEQVDALRDQLRSMSGGLTKSASRGFTTARDYAAEAAQDAEEKIKDNLAVSLILAVGVGILVGLLIRRSS